VIFVYNKIVSENLKYTVHRKVSKRNQSLLEFHGPFEAVVVLQCSNSVCLLARNNITHSGSDALFAFSMCYVAKHSSSERAAGCVYLHADIAII
jgi:hypothetical protein